MCCVTILKLPFSINSFVETNFSSQIDGPYKFNRKEANCRDSLQSVLRLIRAVTLFKYLCNQPVSTWILSA